MRALMYNGPNDMKVTDIPEPTPGDNQVKMRIHYVGICGSDVHGYLGQTGRRTAPMVMGHEFSAQVAEVGGKVTKFKVGDRVTALPLICCGTCDYCKTGHINACETRKCLGVMETNGTFAEYACVDEDMVYKLPDSLDDKTAALIEPFAVSYYAVSKALPLEGKNVIIVGAGTIGLTALACVRHFGAKNIVVVDVSDDRLEAAKKLGATLTIHSGKEDVDAVLKEKGLRKQIDVAFEAVGIASTARETLLYVRNLGTVVWIGLADKMIDIDMQQVVARELTVKGTYVYNAKEFFETIELLASGKVDVSSIISDVVGADEAEAMFRRLGSGDTGIIKILVDMRK